MRTTPIPLFSAFLMSCAAHAPAVRTPTANTPAVPVEAAPVAPKSADIQPIADGEAPSFKIFLPDGWEPGVVREEMRALHVSAFMAHKEKDAQILVSFYDAAKTDGKALAEHFAKQMGDAGMTVSEVASSVKRSSFTWSATDPAGTVYKGKVLTRLLAGGKYGLLLRGAWRADDDAQMTADFDQTAAKTDVKQP